MALIPKNTAVSVPPPAAPQQPPAKQEAKKESFPSFIPVMPKYRLSDMILPEKTIASIRNALALREKSELVFQVWGLEETHKHSSKVGINLYGPPGTGKTMAAHAIAHEFRKKLMIINYADIESKYVGDTPKNITEAFRIAKESDSILFFDEADAILSKRVTNMNNATDTSVNQTRSVLLTLLNDYQGIIIFATNYISNYDPAFMRRILAHIEFELPDLECRKTMYARLIPGKMPTDVNIAVLAEEFEGVSGSDISNAILMAAFAAARANETTVKHHYFHSALSDIKKSQAANQGTVRTDRVPVSEDAVKSVLGTIPS
ncbi:ATP-binding protein [Paenibacillus thermotolerans]|uniref:ATP-binding protein n=1 Tax=Paenibacillus thermotolerans TaxID=3027807 RepID=UPI002367D153|nr:MULTISPECIES: ATP-binding protein [unclassified Paenibacillus]